MISIAVTILIVVMLFILPFLFPNTLVCILDRGFNVLDRVASGFGGRFKRLDARLEAILRGKKDEPPTGGGLV